MKSMPDNRTVDAWVGLIRVSQHLLGSVERDLKQAGFPPLAWYDALLELNRARQGRLRPYELQKAMLLAQYSISRLIDRLVAAGYAKRLVCASDRRGQMVGITDRGKNLLREMWPVYGAAIQQYVGQHLSPDEAATLAALLNKLK